MSDALWHICYKMMEHYEMNDVPVRARKTSLHSYAQKEQHVFEGLPEGVTHIDMLNLLKSCYRDLGLSDSEMMHLEYMLIRTQAQDWQEGQRPIIYKTVQRIAEDRSLLEREINRLEHRLGCKGFIAWHDSKSYKRYGRRCEKTGKIIYAYGVDLSPLLTKYQEITKAMYEKNLYFTKLEQLRDEAGWMSRRIYVVKNYITRMDDTDATNKANAIYAHYKEQIKKRSDRLKEEELNLRITMQYKVIEQLEQLFHDSTNHAYELPTGLRMLPLKAKNVNSGKTTTNCGQSVNMTDMSVENDRAIYNNTYNKSSYEDILCNNTGNNSVDNIEEFERALAHNSTPHKIAYGNTGYQPLQKRNSLKKDPMHDALHQNQSTHTTPSLSSAQNMPITKSDYPNGQSGRTAKDIGMDHLNPTMAMHAMGAAFKHHLPTGYDGFGWHEIIQAAEKMLPLLRIKEHVWREACGTLGRTGAALCILIADARCHEINSYSGFLRACVKKAENGELNLHKSIFGLMKKGEQQVM